ncbi:MAG: radical SAM protein [Candidatus Omnitrophota bacterium]|nr:radical SAM protein [Candidatus Omnitrophota bacterium]
MSETKPETRKRKFLLVSPMLNFGPFLPISISVIISILKKADYEIKLFDTTFYKMPQRCTYIADAVKIGMFKSVNWESYGMDNLKENYLSDFKELVRSFEPDFIGISIFTTFNEKIALSLIDAIDDRFSGRVIVGGIHTYINLDAVKKYRKISAIITGECEDVLIEALDYLYNNIDARVKKHNIANFLYKDTRGNWIDSGRTKVSDIEHIPFLNWDYFDDRNFYRPFHGNVLRMGHIEMARGCPFKCTYCINEHFHKQSRGFWRIKSVDRILKEINFLKNKYDLEAVKFWDDDFLAVDIKKIERVTKGIKMMGLKFLCQSRPEHAAEEKIRIIAENGCIQIGIGVESGSQEYRIKKLNRKMTNERIIDAFKSCRKHSISSTAFCMIGMPDETRADILETAKLLRVANPDVINHAIFTPYQGNSLYQYAKEKNYITEDVNYEDYTKCFLNMPLLSAKEVEGLFKTFILYCRLDDSYYELIRKAEVDNEVFRKLKALIP